MKPGVDPKVWHGVGIALLIMLLLGSAGWMLWGLVHR